MIGRAAGRPRYDPGVAFDPVPPTLDLVGLEHAALERWDVEGVFAESLRRREGAPEWVFYEGPPTANGRPGIHHVWARLFKDLYPRFQTMRGHHVARKGGWDCHGLPVEVQVEQELGFHSKHEIEAYGIAEFNRLCRESVHRYVADFEALTRRIGMWLDTDDAYWTLDNSFIETVWWLFRQMWDAGDIYEGHKVVPYCGRCGTALSSHELGQPGAYREVTEPSVYVRFPVVDRDFDLLVWTTTPWTLVSNVGAAVGPDVEYVRVRTPPPSGHGAGNGRRDLVMAAARVAEVLGDDAEVLGPVAVDDLVGLHYERPFDLLELPTASPERPGGGARVVAADFVTVDDGSGIVHLAPAFGEIDREVAGAEGLPMLNPVGPAATFVDSALGTTPWTGTFVKDADPAIIDALAAAGKVERVVDYAHSYPHCWRCGTPLVYWAKPTWFARTSAHKDELLRENETIGWHPEHIKHGRFGDWLENNVDWALSRDRFWGTPLPVWRCDDCGTDTCIGSVAELAQRSGRDLADLDLHRPAVDEVTIDCSKCEQPGARRVDPVLDAWFDSGSMPAAQFHFPFDAGSSRAGAPGAGDSGADDSGAAGTLPARFPADFICEAIDQTRGWFYSLLAVNTLVFGRTPYRNVVCLALVVDKDGQKMSKSKGNVIDPWTVLDTRGADALRWNFFSAGSPWTPRRVSVEAVDESARFLVTLWNTYSFFVTYANLDGWAPDRATGGQRGAPARATHVLDRWVRSRLHHTVATVTDALDDFDALRGAQAIEGFVDDLSNWYVRRSRARFWQSDDPLAHATLHECLATVARLLAPFTPFVADELWRNLEAETGSVHLADWPDVDADALDPDLEREMERARAVVSLGLSARNESKLKVRQPLRRALVLQPDAATFSGAVAAEVADALNVKELEAVTDLEGLLEYAVVPNFKALAPRVRGQMPLVKDALLAADGGEVKRALDADGGYDLVLPDRTSVRLLPDDVEVRAESHAELALAQEGGYAVAIDTTVDDELRGEGIARDLVRALNDLRKATGFDIADRVRVRIGARGRVEAAAHAHRDRIAREVLAVELEIAAPHAADGASTVEIDGDVVQVELSRVER
jgi:isoleucyl-tRNA synthetase